MKSAGSGGVFAGCLLYAMRSLSMLWLHMGKLLFQGATAPAAPVLFRPGVSLYCRRRYYGGLRGVWSEEEVLEGSTLSLALGKGTW